MVRRIQRPSHSEWYLTGRPRPQGPPAQAATEVFTALADLLAEQGIAVLHEKVYGLTSARPDILGRRAEALARRGLEPSLPPTFLDGAPPSGAEFGGVQAWGVTLAPGGAERVETVVCQGQAVGREWFGPGFRQLALTGLDGRADTPTGGRSLAPEEAARMFERATATLAARGYSFGQVARTWLYMPRILDWYGEFNAVRNAHFSVVGLSKAQFPASTGIQARRDTEHCSMDLLAVDASPGSSLSLRPLFRSSRQDHAFAYGSAFSRAMVLEHRGSKIIHVSGTASIDSEGRSTHGGDVAAQYCETLLSIASLLEAEGATLTDICQGTLFVKSAAIAGACHDVARRLCLPRLPLVEVVADVCRPELLVEIEAVAVV